MTGAITMAAAAVVSVGMGAYAMSQQGGAASDALGMAHTTQGEQQYYNSMLMQLINNPSSVTQLPGYQFQMDQGTKAVADAMGASGFAGSGNEAAALTQFGQGLASSFYGQQTNLLASLSGVTNASSPAQNMNAATGASALSSNTLSSLLNSLTFYGKMGSNTGAPAGTPGQYAPYGDATSMGMPGINATEYGGTLA
jgi:hypothetical protein